jgi:hypothetical protein
MGLTVESPMWAMDYWLERVKKPRSTERVSSFA